MKHYVKIYRGPIIAIALFLALAWGLNGQAYLDALLATLKRPEWWADSTFSVIVFTVLIGWVVELAARHRAAHERLPYEGWKVVVKNGDKTTEAKLVWDEVRRFKESPLEERRFIQSVITSQGRWLELQGLDLLATASWVCRDDDAKEYVLDVKAFDESGAGKKRQ